MCYVCKKHWINLEMITQEDDHMSRTAVEITGKTQMIYRKQNDHTYIYKRKCENKGDPVK